MKQGKALPAPAQDWPGRFPIRNRGDLQNAILAIGLSGCGVLLGRLPGALRYHAMFCGAGYNDPQS